MNKFGELGTYRVLGAQTEIGQTGVIETLDEVEKREEEKRKDWVRRVGEARAEAALVVWRQNQKRTLPEALAEAWLKSRGVRYRAQVPVMGARPDLVLYGIDPLGLVIWRVQGDYWHGKPDAVAGDAMQRERLLQGMVDGQRVMRVADLWEKDIYTGDAVFEAAYHGG